ncbi:MAG: flagellar protein FlaG [Lachnospiraceae bacterium]|nr:flagellar protein FlaG [Lachnospiraceae bacterium]
MAGIEPISSAMTYQAQSTPQARPVTKPEAVDMEVANKNSTVNFDPSTVKIVEANETDTRGQSDSSDSNTQYIENSEKQLQATKDKIKSAVEELNKKMNNSEAVFGIHEETNRVTIKIVDKDTKEVIKELPAEKTLDMIAKILDVAGLLVDEKR